MEENPIFLVSNLKDNEFNLKFLTMYMELKRIFLYFSEENELTEEYSNFLNNLVELKKEDREKLIHYLAYECVGDLFECLENDENLDYLVDYENQSKSLEETLSKTNHEREQSTKSPRILGNPIYRTSFLIQNSMQIILDFLMFNPIKDIESIYFPNGNMSPEEEQEMPALLEFKMAREMQGYKSQTVKLNQSIPEKLVNYNKTLKSYRRNWKNHLGNSDEDKAEKRLFRQFSDLAYVVDIMNRRNFWHQQNREEQLLVDDDDDAGDYANDISE